MKNIKRRRIFADDEMDMPETQVDPAATDLLFEAEDVAELIAEVSGTPVEVTADEDVVTFVVGDDEYTVEAEGDEEILEAVRRPFRGKRPVSAASKSATRRPAPKKGRRVSASTTTGSSKVIRRVPRSKK